MTSFNFLVDRKNLANTQLEAVPLAEIEEGEILVRIDKFALTANNITYAVAGDRLGYWQFFPTREGWGRIPVWGIGTVVESSVDGIESGSRYYGYYPMSGHAAMRPIKVNERGFSDGVEHRQSLPAVYNQYNLMTDELGFPPQQDNYQIVYRPLFTTSFILDDFFTDNEFFASRQIVIASASSKTAFGMAFMLKKRDIKTIGLTSSANLAFVKNLQLYDQIVTYDEVDKLDNSIATAYVDMSGNRQVLSAIHHHFNQQLVKSCGVGITHWQSRDGENPKTLPGARPEMFFAPTQIQKRAQDWGPQLWQTKLAEAWREFLAVVDNWVQFDESIAPEQLNEIYQKVLQGPSPAKAYVVKQ